MLLLVLDYSRCCAVSFVVLPFWLFDFAHIIKSAFGLLSTIVFADFELVLLRDCPTIRLLHYTTYSKYITFEEKGSRNMGRTAAQEAAFANRMLGKAHVYLAAVDEAYILKERGHTLRPMPTFRPEEISLGKELGRGGFGVVCDIRKFTLDTDDPSTPPPPENPQESNEEKDTAGTDDTAISKSNHMSEINESEHYAIDKARQLMCNRVLRQGTPRYALKMLHSELSQVEKARGMIDLALEAKYLSIVWHPNISKFQCQAHQRCVF